LFVTQGPHNFAQAGLELTILLASASLVAGIICVSHYTWLGLISLSGILKKM
jgi:hypothetical protein